MYRGIALVTENDSDEMWMTQLHRIRSSSEQAAAIMEASISCVDWVNNGGTQHSFALLCDVHSKTWFSIEGLAQCVQYIRGTSAGTPLDDAVFCICVVCCLSVIEKGLRNQCVTQRNWCGRLLVQRLE